MRIQNDHFICILLLNYISSVGFVINIASDDTPVVILSVLHW